MQVFPEVDVLELRQRMSGRSFTYSGTAVRAKASCQSASFSGGIDPTIGAQSTIESPDSVRRVIPPTTSVVAVSRRRSTSKGEMPPSRRGIASTHVGPATAGIGDCRLVDETLC